MKNATRKAKASSKAIEAVRALTKHTGCTLDEAFSFISLARKPYRDLDKHEQQLRDAYNDGWYDGARQVEDSYTKD